VTGLRLALTLLSVLPAGGSPAESGAGPPDRSLVGRAICWAPLVGALLGTLAGVIGAVALRLGAPGPVAGFLVVSSLAGLSRGLHLDGLADTADGFGVYARGRERALEAMRSPGTGAFAVIAVVLAIGLQATAASAVLAGHGWSAVPAVATAVAIGRFAATAACVRGVPPARQDGLGALAAGTVPVPALVVVGLVLAAGATGAGLTAAPARPWLGPAAVVAGLLVTALVVRRSVVRFGGITGDVLGAAVELTTATALVVLTATG
jgi:adenosylcobinamide-GDP ribazoletransferase